MLVCLCGGVFACLFVRLVGWLVACLLVIVCVDCLSVYGCVIVRVFNGTLAGLCGCLLIGVFICVSVQMLVRVIACLVVWPFVCVRLLVWLCAC